MQGRGNGRKMPGKWETGGSRDPSLGWKYNIESSCIRSAFGGDPTLVSTCSWVWEIVLRLQLAMTT